mmetsp:Transcript_30669/g.34959  ORF Transcript_30669/g.34959 Transcript_30669/m.34959 type:complete len:92 (-) Transcript_30669:166-441(-)|eukprot:CAMPEP_0194134188 /NCGR_PEP_ID=MMETSP0152-20130528/4275_1 /TAXON_ID=1049557 /ORGANISM="Thalassiothrix antarctica, Strain L6-D1" /LENGTH=91 /DNA_ID=CAMNT_0038829807 /DNA_START=54 /DNA_END=329 /DNA_ORIENTATION=-
MESKSNNSKTENPEVGAYRESSVDSAAFFEGGDKYDDYGDFDINNGNNGGGGGHQKTVKRQENRGGGMNNVYSTKHTRMKTQQQQNNKDKK